MWNIRFLMTAQFCHCGDKHSAELMQFNLKRLSDLVHRNRRGQSRIKDSPMRHMQFSALKWQLSYAVFKP